MTPGDKSGELTGDLLYVLMVLMLRKLSERILHFYLLSDTNSTKRKKTWIKYTALEIN